MTQTLRYYGQFEPPVDRFIFERYFPDRNIHGVFVECGAFDGQLECSCKLFEESMGWRGFNLEPVPWLFESLTRNRPLSRNLNLALSNRSGDVAFKHAISPLLGRDFGNGSIQHTAAHLQYLQENGCKFQDIRVKAITWRNFVAQETIDHVDLFVLDVEGHEVPVIEGTRGSNTLPDVMCVEFGHVGLETIRHELGELGYVYDISSHANAYFVRKEALALFALRRAAVSPRERSLETGSDLPKECNTDALQEENRFVRQRVDELCALYEQIIHSKGWLFVEFLREVKRAILPR